MGDDLNLKDLEQHHGTVQYHRGWLNTNLTDGVAYISNNGYSWLVTDAITVIKMKLKNHEFLSIKLKLLADNKAQMTITDGNDKILYKQDYGFTTAKKEIQMFYVDNVMLLSQEY